MFRRKLLQKLTCSDKKYIYKFLLSTMKIQSITIYNVKSQNYTNNITQQQTNQNYQTSALLQIPSYNTLFKGVSPKYLRAQAYLNTVRRALGGFKKSATNVYIMDLNKLDGIQEGLKVFDGLNFKEIAFISQSLVSIAVNRGCSNLCSYCYAKAMPPKKESSNYINKMSWDDFTALTDGFEELNNRLGFYISAPGERSVFRDYFTAFHDADCMELVLKDNDNKEHDFIDISKKIYNSTGILPVFDTSGWTPKFQTMQQRAEKFADYYSNCDNIKKMISFNVSINPFHILNTKSVLERKAGNIERANKFQDLYIERMANTFFTFTPLLKKGYLNIIYRAVSNYDENSEFDGFRFSDLECLSEKILSKLKEMYVDDFNGKQKYITNKKQINDYIHNLKHMMDRNGQRFLLSGRGIETFGKNNPYYDFTRNKIIKDNQVIEECESPEDLLEENISGIIDANGDYYITTFLSTYPTELKLNFANKDKQTAPIDPSLQENLVITKKVINNHELESIYK